MKKKDQEAIASLYTEGKSFIPPMRYDDGTDGEYSANLEDDKHAYQDTYQHDLINSKEYQSVATIVDNLRNNLDDRIIWDSIMDINTGDKNKILTALDELGVNPRFRANKGGAVFRDED
jgi:hypothetical protein